MRSKETSVLLQAITLFTFAVPALTSAAGTTIGGETIGVGFNNRYDDSDTKTDWLGFGMDVNDPTVTATIEDLSETIPGQYRNFRIGFSRAMASDPTDLNQWLDTVEEVINGGNKVMVAGWFQNDISDSVGDAAHWLTVLNAIESRGLTDGISGYEIQNEPSGNGSDWGLYARQLWKATGGFEATGYNSLNNSQRQQIAAAWHDKPIVIQGTSYGQNFSSDLVNRVSGMPNLVWSAHHYAKFSGIQPERENWTVEQWQSFMVNKWTNNHALLNDNVIVTELGTSGFIADLTGMGPAGTTAEDRRNAGFVRAAREYYTENDETTIFWYTAYNVANIGIGEWYGEEWNPFNLDSTNYVFFGSADPEAPAGTTNVALGRPATADSINGSNAPSRAVDGVRLDNGSRWLSSNTALPHWFAVDLEDANILQQARIYTGFNKYNRPIEEFKLQRRVGDEWVDFLTITDNNNPAMIIDFDPILADEVRLLALTASDDIIRLYDFQLFGKAALPGDLDADGDVDDADYGLAFAQFTGPGGTGKNAVQGDLDGDGDIDDADFGLAFASFTGPNAAVNVPEPASAACVGLLLFLASRRRR